MDTLRIKKLKRNSRLLFWGRAFLNVKILNAVLSLFYAANNLDERQIIWVSLFWAMTTLLFEIPSSYMADRWGRKNTLLFGAFFALMQWVVLLFADGFAWVALSMICYGLWSASFSGTDIALLYDSKRELEEEEQTLKELGSYASAMNLFKVFTILLGVYIARDLTDAQFDTLIWIDIIATTIGFVLLLFLKEPNHYMDVEEQEAGIFKDAFKLLKGQPLMQRAIVNRVLLFLASYTIWSYYHVFFTSLGVAVLYMGAGWSMHHLVAFFIKKHAHIAAEKLGLARAINVSTVLYGTILLVFVCLYFLGIPGQILFIVWVLSSISMAIRWPLFDQYFNAFSASYNRATTLSLTNLFHNLMEFPILLTAGFLVAFNPIYPYIFAIVIVILLVVLSPVGEKTV